MLESFSMSLPGAIIDEYMAVYIREVGCEEARAFYGREPNAPASTEGDVTLSTTSAPAVLIVTELNEEELLVLHHIVLYPCSSTVCPIQPDLSTSWRCNIPH